MSAPRGRADSVHGLTVAVGPEAADEAELADFFEDCPRSLAQETPAWRRVITSLGVDESRTLVCRRAGRIVAVLPAYRFEGPLGAILTSCAQAGPLGGVACRAGVEPEEPYRALLAAFEAEARENACVVASVISNPFWPDRERLERLFAPDYVLENRCQVLDLSRSLDEHGEFVGADPKLRYNLRRAQNGTLEIDDEQSPANVEEWHAIHVRRHGEIGVHPLPKSLLESALVHAVPRDKARFVFVRETRTRRMVAGALFVFHGAVMDMLIGSGLQEYARHRSNYLTALHAMRFARKRGLRYFNWQGSPPDSGVYRYKRGWGSEDFEYAYLTRVTGDVGPILRSTPAAVSEAYRWHYVLPFDRIGTDAESVDAPSSRSAAWSASRMRPSEGRP